MTRRLILMLLALLLPVLHAPAAAGTYDLIVANSIDLTLCRGCGITLAGLDYGLIVNTDAADITLTDLRQATFSVSASRPEIGLIPFINIPNEQIVGAIHPGEAMGSIISGNTLLLPFIRPGERLRNLAGMQFMAYEVDRPGSNDYEGPIDFDIRMIMAGYEARFTIHAQVHLGPHAIRFLTAERVSAAPANRPPDCSLASADPTELWPANHQLVPIHILGVTDPEDDPVTIVVTSITQDEPLSNRSAGLAPEQGILPADPAVPGEPPVSDVRCADARIVDGRAYVRAERSGGGNGRVYAISFTATDGRGGECDGTVHVCVPHVRGQGCVDDGQAFNSLEGCARGGGPPTPSAGSRLIVRAVAPGVTTLAYSLAQDADVEMELYDVAGRRVATLEKGSRSTGDHSVTWTSSGTPRGVYFVRFRAGQQVVSRTLVLVND